MSSPWFYENVEFDHEAAYRIVLWAGHARQALFEAMTTRWHAAELALGGALGPFADELESGVRDNIARLDHLAALIDDLLADVHRAQAAYYDEHHRRLALRALYEDELERDRQRAAMAAAGTAAAGAAGARP